MLCLYMVLSHVVLLTNNINIHIDQNQLDIFYSSCKPKTYLLSYPTSGNTWCRYCLEFLTKRPTLWKYNEGEHILSTNCPLGNMFDLGTVMDNDPIWKVHDRHMMEDMGTFDPEQEVLLLLVINIKEAVTRHEGIPDTEQSLQETCFTYFDALRLYDEWHPDRRLLIYYEDLILQPVNTFKKIIAFLGHESDYIQEFMQHYETHRQNCIYLYYAQSRTPMTKGNYILYHSRKISPRKRKWIDKTVAKLYPNLWNTYIKDRYSEKAFKAIAPDYVIASMKEGTDYAYDYYKKLAKKDVLSTKHYGNIRVEITDDGNIKIYVDKNA